MATLNICMVSPCGQYGATIAEYNGITSLLQARAIMTEFMENGDEIEQLHITEMIDEPGVWVTPLQIVSPQGPINIFGQFIHAPVTV